MYKPHLLLTSPNRPSHYSIPPNIYNKKGEGITGISTVTENTRENRRG